MEAEESKRLKSVFRQLLEMAQGNLASRIERSDKNDDLEALSALVNMAAEEIQDAFLHEGFVNNRNPRHYLVQFLIVLDEKGEILTLSDASAAFLRFERRELTGRHILSILMPECTDQWVKISGRLRSGRGLSERSMSLIFRSRNGLNLPVRCRLIYFRNGSQYTGNLVITAFEASPSIPKTARAISGNTNKGIVIRIRREDIAKYRSISDRIRKNPEIPLPSLRTLAHEYGTNEFKLKHGFKRMFGITVFQYLKQERLRKAYALVAYSETPFKQISKMTGFRYTSHFSKEFKRFYGFTPREIRQNNS
ncbi:helix-turn-helix domain-containing protein [Robertkochia solimangrovi]|uniref:helix-turn-helix domain-containing protein n=1 Tax=Robertkochia solimangrovi TaxID=2213046 RepID=UPI00117F1C9D|nr:helix-turn-helix domain-containing protein [Robertkochia solimangrovi]TRZ46098.1 hypothetical protein DMZ48_02190 [Robertkochia solimangrovi]